MMEIKLLKSILWSQFGASIDALGNAIHHCPEKIWDNDKKIWYHAYHCTFFLDYYLSFPPSKFSPPFPFDESEFEDRLPNRTYTKEEVLEYLSFCRKKCKSFIQGLTETSSLEHWVNQSKTMDYNIVELLLYNMRHVQHHAAQINLLLRQEIDDAPSWVFHAEEGI